MSLHPGGIAGSVTVLVLLSGPILLVLTLLVGWEGWRTGAHSTAQAVIATVWPSSSPSAHAGS